MKKLIQRATAGMNERFSTNFSAAFVELLLLPVVVLVIGTPLGIGACIALGDLRWQYFAVSYAAVAILLVMAFCL